MLTKLATTISVSLLALAGCTVGLPDGSTLVISLLPPSTSTETTPETTPVTPATHTGVPAPTYQPPPKPHIELGPLLTSFGISPILGAVLYQYGFRPLRKRRENKK